MSRIYFHTLVGDLPEIRGSERAYAGLLCNDLAVALFEPHSYFGQPQIKKLMGWEERERSQGQLAQDFRVHIGAGFGSGFADGTPFFDACLNTALTVGNDAVRLLARLHGQCELHAYVRGENRPWLAGIIKEGREQGVLRADQGWEELAEALVQGTEDVVTSYSVCDQFPDSFYVADTIDADTFYELPDEEQWALCWAKLTEYEGLELKPENWKTLRFGNGKGAFELLKWARTKTGDEQ